MGEGAKGRSPHAYEKLPHAQSHKFTGTVVQDSFANLLLAVFPLMKELPLGTNPFDPFATPEIP